MLQFRIWYQSGDTEPKTMNRIAKALGMTPQPHIRDMLLELVDEGKLKFNIREKSGRWAARAFYPVLTDVITEKYFRRSIRVNHKGQQAGQLEFGL